MRRQLGASAIDMDAVNGYARAALPKPQSLTIATFNRIAYSAGYTLKAVELEVVGDIVGTQLRIQGTKEHLDLRGGPKTGQQVLLRGTLVEGKGGRDVLEVKESGGP